MISEQNIDCSYSSFSCFPEHENRFKLNTEEPTCFKAGRTYKLCSCGDVIDEVIIPAKGHSEELKKVVGEEPIVEKVGY